MYRLAKHRGWDNNFLPFAGFSIRDTNLVEIEH
jgi:hypothetical protein